MLVGPVWILEKCSPLLHHRLPFYVILESYANSQFSRMNRSLLRTPFPWSPTWRILWFLTGYLVDGAILGILDHIFWLFLTCLEILSSLAWIKECQECHALDHMVGGLWMTPGWISGEWGYSWDKESQLYIFLELYYTNFWPSSMNKSVSRKGCPQSLAWWMLLVPYWKSSNSWHYKSLLFVIIELYGNFQLASINKRESRIPYIQCHTWRTLVVPAWTFGGFCHLWYVVSSKDNPRNLPGSLKKTQLDLPEILQFERCVKNMME